MMRTQISLTLAHGAGTMVMPSRPTPIYRHRGHRDASLGVSQSKNPGTNATLRRAWLQGWTWFHLTTSKEQTT